MFLPGFKVSTSHHKSMITRTIQSLVKTPGISLMTLIFQYSGGRHGITTAGIPEMLSFSLFHKHTNDKDLGLSHKKTVYNLKWLLSFNLTFFPYFVFPYFLPHCASSSHIKVLSRLRLAVLKVSLTFQFCNLQNGCFNIITTFAMLTAMVVVNTITATISAIVLRLKFYCGHCGHGLW